MATTKWGRKETMIWPPHSPIYTYGAVFIAVVLTGLLHLLPVQLWQRLVTAFLYADLYPIEHRRSNRSGPPEQLSDAHGGRSRNSTASGDERRRDRRHNAGTGRQTHSTCALAVRLAERLCSALPRTGAELYRRVLECLPQKCDLRWRWSFRHLRAPALFRSRITDHPAPIFYRQGRTTAATTEIRTTTERSRDDDAERIQPQGRWRWHRHQDRRG